MVNTHFCGEKGGTPPAHARSLLGKGKRWRAVKFARLRGPEADQGMASMY